MCNSNKGKRRCTYDYHVLALLAGAAAALDLDELAQDAEGGLLVVGVAVRVQGLLYLPVNDVEVDLLLLVAVVALVDEADAGIDALGGRLPHVQPMVLEGVEDELYISFSSISSILIEYSIECHDRVLLAELSEHEDRAVLLHVVGFGVAVFLQELYGRRWPLVDGLGRILAACLGEDAQALGRLLNELFVAQVELLENGLHNLLDVVDDPRLSADPHHFVDGQDGSELGVQIA